MGGDEVSRNFGGSGIVSGLPHAPSFRRLHSDGQWVEMKNLLLTSEAFVSSLFETSVQLADVDVTANPLKKSRNHFRFVSSSLARDTSNLLFLFSLPCVYDGRRCMCNC